MSTHDTKKNEAGTHVQTEDLTMESDLNEFGSHAHGGPLKKKGAEAFGNSENPAQPGARRRRWLGKGLMALGAIVVGAGLGMAAVYVLSTSTSATEERQTCDNAGLTLPSGFAPRCLPIISDAHGISRSLQTATFT